MAHASWQRARLLRQAVPVWPRRLPRHTLALAVCALALLLGIAVADDYEIFGDAGDQREIGEATLRHLAGESGLNLLTPPTERLYGPIFETPLAVIERLLGGDDSRRVYLSRHLLTHLFFVAAAFAGYLLAWRIFANRWLALFVLLLFLLHPRIYAHSFFNSKDVPFLAMFMICLWLAHRAFRPQSPADIDGAAVKDGAASYGAFAICGTAAGALTNLGIAGLGLVAAVVLLRLFDVIGARRWDERRSAIVSGLLFAVASVATYYATMPYLWADPLERFGEIVTVMLAHPNEQPYLFQGELVRGSQLPRSYLPIWFGITTPPLALALGVVGLAALVWRAAHEGGGGGFASEEARSRLAHPLTSRMAALLRNTPLRFELLVGASFAVPVLAVVVLQPTLYGGWRHFYFLWAPLVLLAASGLRTLAEGGRSACRRLLPFEVPAVAVVAVLAALGLGAIAVEMARMHPDQERYFNVLATGPDAALPLRQRYYQRVVGPYRSITYILEELAAREGPDSVFNVKIAQRRWAWRTTLLSEHDRQRFMFDPARDVDFFHVRAGIAPLVTPPVLYERRLYGEPMMLVGTPDLSRVHAAVADVYRALYRDVTAGVPAFSGETDVYRDETSVTWVKESCPAGGVNRAQRMILIPLDAPRAQQRFNVDGVRVGDACLWQSTLPEYAVGKILFFDGIGTLVSDVWLQESRRRHAAISAAPPAARSTFDVYLEDGALTYIKSPCVRADTEAPFFVHVVPVQLGDLPRFRRRFGFEALDFRFGASKRLWRTVAGDIFDGVCMATLTLPDYPIANIATGQHTPGGGSLWRVDIGGG